MFDQTKDKIKEALDISDVINSYIPLKRFGNNFKALCPFHSEKTPSFSVNVEKQIYYCFGCQKGGDVFQFVIDYEQTDFFNALKILAQRAGMPLPEKSLSAESSSDRNKKDELFQIHDRLANWFHENLSGNAGKSALDYISGRSVSQDVLNTFRIGFAPESWNQTLTWGKKNGFDGDAMLQAGVCVQKTNPDNQVSIYDRFRNRLMFPIWNELGKVIGFSGRILGTDDSGGKYINTPETLIFHKGKVLYGLNLARNGIKKNGFALICEGQMDVIACHQAGYANAIAPMGTAFTEAQARLLKRYTDQVVFLFDGDGAGQNAVIKSIDSFLPVGLSAKVAVLESGDDPDTLVRSGNITGLKEKIDGAIDYFIYRIDIELSRHDPNTPSGKTTITENILKEFLRIESLVSRGEYCRILAKRLSIPENTVLQELKRIMTKSKQPAFRYASDENRQQAESNVTQLDNVEGQAEIILLELAIYDEKYAGRLLKDLPLEYISDNAVGRALNEILAHTEQGEWQEAVSSLAENMGKYQSEDINKVINDPNLGANIKPIKLESDYILNLYQKFLLGRVKRKINDIQIRINQASSESELAKLKNEIAKLYEERRRFSKRHKEAKQEKEFL